MLPKTIQIQYKSFTTRHRGRANVLKTPVQVAEAFDPKTVAAPPSTKQYTGIWDTGATNSVITQNVIDACQLKPTGITQVSTASGVVITETYLVAMMLPNHVGFPQVRVTKGNLTPDADLLIGMDIIGTGDFAVTHLNGITVFSFRVPSFECIDFVQAANQAAGKKLMADGGDKVGRNEPCPCGSGQKYKRCHGK